MSTGAASFDYYDFLVRQIQQKLPTLPTIVNELTNVLQNPDSSTFAVEDVMISDAPMTTRILRVANTSYYRGNREKVTDANEAIGTLGFEKIRNVVLTTSVFKMFSGPSAAEKFSLEGLWKHCLGVASASRSIARYLGKSWHETAYTCGLLHDIGKVARFKLDEDDGTSVFINDSQTSLDKKISLIQAELINQSPRHDYLGYLICKNWGLSKLVEGVVRWHHEPNLENRQRIASEETNELIDLVMLANWVVNEKGFGFSGHEQPEKPSDALLNRLNIHPAHLEHVSATVDNELELTEDFCKMLDDV
jgi:putative nucleotidyltransferase with HDIG domain